MEKLNSGDLFPKFEVQTVDQGRLAIPEGLAERYAILLFYRGWW